MLLYRAFASKKILGPPNNGFGIDRFKWKPFGGEVLIL